MGKKSFIKGLLIVLALSLYCGHLLRASRAGGPAAAAAQVDKEAEAKALFKEKCARCHGADGRGQTVLGEMLGVPDFTDENWWKEEKSDKRFVTSITHGKGDMPAFGKKLSRQEISALVAHVRGFGKVAR